MRASAFVPAHISGFFQVCEADEPERKGSRNCGPCLDVGVLTEVRAERADRASVRVSINGESSPHAKTTLSLVERLLRSARAPFRVEVNHSCQVQVGAGYGASGAGALGAALALSKALGLRIPREKLVAMAHVAEVVNSTGLGDVGAQAIGGLVIGLKPGGPPHGAWMRIPTDEGLRVVYGTLGPLSTKEILSDEGVRRRSVELGETAMKVLLAEPTPKRFVEVSLKFAEGLGLLDEELLALIKAAAKAGAIGASQVMLGRAVFALAEAEKSEEVKRAFLELLEPGAVGVASLDSSGARLL